MKTAARSGTPLAGVLTLLLPSSAQTLLLRAALLPADRARAALESWQSRCDDPTEAIAAHRGGGRRLAPIISENLADFSGSLDPRLATYLRTAAMREELRAREYRKICHGVLRTLERAGVEVIVLKGAALSELVYPRADLRHSHDIDVLIRDSDAERARTAVSGIGFESVPSPGPGFRTSRHYVHESGLPLALHSRLFTVGPYNAIGPEALARAERRTILDVPVKVLCPADQLVHICAHASTGGQRANLMWVCDAWFVLAASPDLDWDMLVHSCERGRMCLPVHVMLGYLARELDAPVDESIMERMAAEAMRADRLEREIALFGAWAGPGIKLPSALRRSRDWRERSFVAGWRLLPSPSSAASASRIRSPYGWPVWYLGRPLRLLAHGVRALIGRGRPVDPSGERRPAT